MGKRQDHDLADAIGVAGDRAAEAHAAARAADELTDTPLATPRDRERLRALVRLSARAAGEALDAIERAEAALLGAPREGSS
jgi:hypothetical protein